MRKNRDSNKRNDLSENGSSRRDGAPLSMQAQHYSGGKSSPFVNNNAAGRRSKRKLIEIIDDIESALEDFNWSPGSKNIDLNPIKKEKP